MHTAALNVLRLAGFRSFRTWPTGGDARHHGAAGNGAATTAIDSRLNFKSAVGLYLGACRTLRCMRCYQEAGTELL